MSSSGELKAAVIGFPVKHSLSPALFSMISSHEKIHFDYQKIEVTPEELKTFLEAMRKDSQRVGLSVTIPHKENVMKFLDEIAPEASALGAVNMVQRRVKAGVVELWGTNTDVVGIEKSFEELKLNLAGKNVFLWGAGGAAKAVAYVLGKLQVSRVVIFNPRSTRGSDLAQRFNAIFPKTQFESISNVSEVGAREFLLAVNSTPVGMKDGDESSFFSGLETLRFEKNAAAFDLIYTPEDTLFLQRARQQGLQTLGGLTMLIEQALAAWIYWMAPIHNHRELKDELSSYLRGVLRWREQSNPIFLTGFMGVGKTSVARSLSKITGREFLDTDEQIESEANQSIPEIFKKGEAEFRRLEKETIRKVSGSKQTIISLGGGALNDEVNLKTVLEKGVLIYLQANEETLFQRIKKQGLNRPLLAGLSEEGRKDKIKNLLEVRKPIYAKAHFSVMTDGLEPLTVAQKILMQMGEQPWPKT